MKKYYEKRNKTILIALSLPVIIISIAAGRYFTVLNKINHIEVPEIEYSQSTIPEETYPSSLESTESTMGTSDQHVPSVDDFTNFLIVGQSSRAGEEGRLADTMILCTLNSYEKTLRLTSLLRDSFVKFPDYRGHTGGRIKLTVINQLGYHFGNGIAGSMELMNLTLFHNFGIEVDHNFEIDFDCFVDVIDMLGGVNIDITEAEAKYLNRDNAWVHHEFSPGEVHLNGMEALSYVRMRKAEGDGESDIKRTARQRKLLGIIMNEMKKRSVSELGQIADAVLPRIATSMDNQDMTKLLLLMLPMLPELEIIEGGTCPTDYSGDMVDIYGDGFMHSVLRFDEAETKRKMRIVTKGA